MAIIHYDLEIFFLFSSDINILSNLQLEDIGRWRRTPGGNVFMEGFFPLYGYTTTLKEPWK